MAKDITARTISSDIAARIRAAVQGWDIFDTCAPSEIVQGSDKLIAIGVDIGEPYLSDGKGETIIFSATATVTCATCSDATPELVETVATIGDLLAQPSGLILQSRVTTDAPNLDEAGVAITITLDLEALRAVETDEAQTT